MNCSCMVRLIGLVDKNFVELVLYEMLERPVTSGVLPAVDSEELTMLPGV